MRIVGGTPHAISAPSGCLEFVSLQRAPANLKIHYKNPPIVVALRRDRLRLVCGVGERSGIGLSVNPRGNKAKFLKPRKFELNRTDGPLNTVTARGLQWRPSVSRLTLALSAAVSSFLSFTLPALAQEDVPNLPQPSFPVPWQMNLQTPVTPVAEMMYNFHTFLFWVITVISVFVAILLLIVIFRFNEKANPVPAKWSHNTLLEVLWTAIPVLVLVVIAVPSYRLLYYMDRTSEAEMTLKVTGNQWYWSYEYPDNEITFDALTLQPDEIDAAKGQHRLLETDNHVVLPVNTNIRILFTATDVIHAWAIPAFGVKLDNMPGRVNETWTRVTKLGRYYGECSELCGVDHSNMPIVVDIVSKDDYLKWVSSKKPAEGTGTGQADTVKLAAQ